MNRFDGFAEWCNVTTITSKAGQVNCGVISIRFKTAPCFPIGIPTENMVLTKGYYVY